MLPACPGFADAIKDGSMTAARGLAILQNSFADWYHEFCLNFMVKLAMCFEALTVLALGFFSATSVVAQDCPDFATYSSVRRLSHLVILIWLQY
jgi:hypothetical protein